MPIPNRRKPRIYKGSMPPQQPKKQHMPPKYGNPDDGGRNELPMPERAAECRMQGQQQYIMEPPHTTPGKIPGTGAAPLWSKDTLAQEAKIPDTGGRPMQIRMMPLRRLKFRCRRTPRKPPKPTSTIRRNSGFGETAPFAFGHNADKLLPDAKGHIWQPQKQTCI